MSELVVIQDTKRSLCDDCDYSRVHQDGPTPEQDQLICGKLPPAFQLPCVHGKMLRGEPGAPDCPHEDLEIRERFKLAKPDPPLAQPTPCMGSGRAVARSELPNGMTALNQPRGVNAEFRVYR